MKKEIIFYLTVFLLILAYSITTNAFDYDLWARLIAGMGFIDGGHVLTQDFLSYPTVHLWFDHEWGAGVIFYSVLKFFGPKALIILQAILSFSIFFVCSKIIKLRGNKSPYNILIYLFVILSIIQNLNNPIRCHMFSFLFFTIFIYILEKVRRGNNKLLYLIPVIVLFWNNIHGGVVSGLGLIGMFALGEFLNKKPFFKYIITLLVSSIVLLINPWGFPYVKFLLMANTMPRPEIVEWWSIFSKYFMYKRLVFKALILFTVIVESIVIFKDIKLNKFKQWYDKADKFKYILLLSTLYLSIIHVKLLPFFALSVLCYVYEDIYKITNNIKLPKINKTLICIFIIFTSLFSFVIKDFNVPVGLKVYPVKEVEFIKINNLKGKILTSFQLGSYVSYKLYPNNLIFMDGRYEEVYYAYMLPMLQDFLLYRNNWNNILINYPPDVMIIEKDSNIYSVLKDLKDWSLVYEETNFAVFIPSKDANRKFITPTDDLKYYQKTLFDTNIKFTRESK